MKRSMHGGVSRREFIRRAGVVAASMSAPMIVPATVRGQGRTAPNDRIVMGAIGIRGQGGGDMHACMSQGDVQVVAICDVDAGPLEQRRREINGHYHNEDCATYHDYRELLARDDIDAVVIGTPDHWHAMIAIEAAKRGKDIYCEKPLSHKLLEGRAMCDAVSRYGRIFQVGSQQRSGGEFRRAVELVKNGRIGKVRRIEVGLPGGGAGPVGGYTGTPPDGFDYDFWLGPAPWKPFHPQMIHWNWRWNLDTGGGQLMDWIGHHNDIAHWAMGYDHTGPIEIQGVGEFPREGIYTAATRYRIECLYADGVRTTIAGGHNDIQGGTKWIGDDGWVWVNRGRIDAGPKRLLEEKIGADEIRIPPSPGHQRNFLDSVKSREPTLCVCETGHRSATPGHLGLISMLLGGRKLKWDPDKEAIVGDAEAARLLARPYRAPWHLG